MVTRYVLALLIAFCVFIGLQMMGFFNLVQIQYRVWTLHRLESREISSIPWAMQYLNSDDPHLRAAAARGLGRIGQANTSVVSALIEKLNSDVPRVASESARALGNVKRTGLSGSNSVSQLEISDALVRALSHKNCSVRLSAAYSISERRFKSKQAIPSLVKCLPDQRMGFMAARALGNLRARESAGDIAALLGDTSLGYQVEAIDALRKMEPLPVEIQTQIDQLLENSPELEKYLQ